MLLLGIHEADEPGHEEAKVADGLPDEGRVEKLGIVCVDGSVQGGDVGFELGDSRLSLSLQSRILHQLSRDWTHPFPVRPGRLGPLQLLLRFRHGLFGSKTVTDGLDQSEVVVGVK